MVEAEEDDEEDDTMPFFIDTITSEPALVYSLESKWMAQLKIANLDVNFKFDMGLTLTSSVNRPFKKLVPRPALKKSPITMRAYNGKLIPSLGVCQVTLKHKDKDMSAVFAVVPSNCQAWQIEREWVWSSGLKASCLRVKRISRKRYDKSIQGYGEGMSCYQDATLSDWKMVLVVSSMLPDTLPLPNNQRWRWSWQNKSPKVYWHL